MAVVHPQQVIVASDAAEYARLRAYLTSVGYAVGSTAYGTRTDNDATLTVTIDHPSWSM